jgi:zinc/manganese transport system permease protein
MDTLLFLFWPFLACLLLILIHTWFGIHILERGIIFVDLSLAQFTGIGIALSFLFGGERITLFAVLFALLGALILSLTRQIGRYVNVEAFIGVLYIFSFATCSLILDRTPHGMEEFKGLLNGSILWVTPRTLTTTALLYGVVGLLHLFLHRRFQSLSKGEIRSFGLELLFFASFALVLVKSVLIAGIIQVFAFLVLPALTGRLFFDTPRRILITGWLVGTVASLGGILLSHLLDLPTAPLIVGGLAVTFFLGLAIRIGTSPNGKCILTPVQREK